MQVGYRAWRSNCHQRLMTKKIKDNLVCVANVWFGESTLGYSPWRWKISNSWWPQRLMMKWIEDNLLCVANIWFEESSKVLGLMHEVENIFKSWWQDDRDVKSENEDKQVVKQSNQGLISKAIISEESSQERTHSWDFSRGCECERLNQVFSIHSDVVLMNKWYRELTNAMSNPKYQVLAKSKSFE